MTIKKIVSTVLAVLLAASSLASFAGCRKKTAEPVKEKRTNVYAGEDIELPEDVRYVQRIVAAGGKAYLTYEADFMVTYNDEGTEVERKAGYDWEQVEKLQADLPEGWYIGYEYKEMLCVIDIDTKTTSSVPFDFDQDAYGYMSSNLFPAPDGHLMGITNKWEYNEDYTESTSYFYLVNIDPATGSVSSTSLNDALAKGGCDPTMTYINSSVVRGDELILGMEGGTLLVTDLDGNYKGKMDLNMQDGWINSLGVSGDRLVVMYYDQNGQKLKYAEGSGDFVQISNDVIGSNGSLIACDNENIYFNSSTGISAYHFADGSYKEVLNYINSDILNSGSIAFLEDGRLLMATTDWSKDTSVTTLSVYHRVPDEELADEIILRLGCIYTDYTLRGAIIRFNKQNTGVRVTVVDYSSYNNEDNGWTGAAKQFNNDIATGKLPDIVQLDTSLPIDSYFHKNIFADLNAFIDDPEIGIDRSTLEENILTANLTKGKLNSLILLYSVNTLLAKSDKVGKDAGWTFEDMMKAIRTMPADSRAFFEYSRDNILESFFQYSMDSFIDWDTGKTYFDTNGFIEFANYLKTCPEKGYWEELYGDNYEYDPDRERQYEEEYALRFYHDKALFQMAYFSSFTDYLYSLNQFATTDVTAIGYPREGEGNGAVIIPSLELAISAKSTAKNQAWDFIKYLLNDENIMNPGWQFSISKAAMEEMYQSAQENYGDNYGVLYDASVNAEAEVEEDIDAEEAADEADFVEEPKMVSGDYNEYDWMREAGYSEEYIDFQKNSHQPYNQAAVDYIRGIIEGASKIARTDSELVDIVKEDLSAVFAGAKSAADAAKQIASRVGIYVSEHS
ncbi:MAG: extracellular solute-binding protein [Clostridia bacterium]|nr:extracellular solute-binding protein [Clostridia bacterium]